LASKIIIKKTQSMVLYH